MTGATCGAGYAHSSGTPDLTVFVGVSYFLNFVVLSGLLIFDRAFDVDCVVICIHFYFLPYNY